MGGLTRFALRRPATTLVLAAATTALLATGLPRLRTETGYRAFLGAAHPAILALDRVAERFGGGVPFAVIWSCAESPACENALDRRSLAMAHDVARFVSGLPGVLRVEGPATSPLLVQELLSLPETVRLAPGGEPAANLAEWVPVALADPLWAGQIVSEDGRAGALLVLLAHSSGTLAERVLDATRSRLAEWEREGFRFALVGGPVEFVVAGRELDRDARRVTPLLVALVGVVLAGLFRAPGAALVSLAAVGVAVLGALGLQGWLGWPRNNFSQALPPLLLVIGVCDAVHLLSAAAARLAPGADRAARRAALAAAADAVGPACLATTLTTAAGFASFAVSGLESLARFGWMAAFGVGAALLTSFTLVPVAVAALPGRLALPSAASGAWRRRGPRLGAWLVRRRRPVLAVAALLLVLGGLGMTRLRVDARFEDLYGEESQVVRWVHQARAALRDAETLEVALELPAGLEPWDPQALRVLAQVEALEALPGLARPLSALAPLSRLHALLHGEPLRPERADPERTRALHRFLRAEEPELLGLFLREGAEGRPAALRVVFQAEKLPQAELRALLSEVDRRLAALPAGFEVTVAGPLATVSRMIDEIRATQLQSFALAFALVGVLAALFLRSARAGALALLPTVLPVVAALGAMGLAGIPLDVGTAMVAAVILGLAIDDALHLLAALRRRTTAGEALPAAVAGALGDVGGALVTTSAALAAGFLAVALVPWSSLASFGVVCALAIGAALAADLLVLPALLLSIGGAGMAAGSQPPETVPGAAARAGQPGGSTP